MAVTRLIESWLTSRQMGKGWGLPFHWGGGELIVAAILIVGVLSLGSGMFGRWINGAGEGGLLPVPLHSLGKADYGVDEITRPIPAIGLEIIQDLLGIEEPPETGGLPEIAMIITGDPSPTPTPTIPIIGEIPLTATPTANNLESATATKGPGQSATPFPTGQATPIPTSTISPPDAPIPTSTISPPDTPVPTSTISPPDTPIPTSTPGINATSTPMPTQMLPTATAPIPATSKPSPSPLPPPTNIPNPSPTPLPVISATLRPTRSSTLAATAQYTHTPAVTAGTPSLP